VSDSKPVRLSVKALVTDSDGRRLVLKRSMASKNNPGKWDLPGGKCDPSEAIDEGLRREVLEESGLEIEVGRVIGAAESESPSNRVAYLVFEALARPGEVRLSGEHDEFAWLYPRELTQLDLVRQFRPLVIFEDR